MGAVSFCDGGGYVCGDWYVTFLCDDFGGHSSTVMDGFADALVCASCQPESNGFVSVGAVVK